METRREEQSRKKKGEGRSGILYGLICSIWGTWPLRPKSLPGQQDRCANAGSTESRPAGSVQPCLGPLSLSLARQLTLSLLP